jgi:hypothetical protein
MRGLSNFIQLRPEERNLLVRALLLVGMMRLGLLFLPFQRLQHLSAKRGWRKEPQVSAHYTVSRVLWSVRVASSFVPGATCLCRSLAAQRLLAQQGRVVKLRIGVAKREDGIFHAHAWLEDPTGLPLEEADVSPYRPLFSLESPGE